MYMDQPMIFKTKDYAKFNLIKGNRGLDNNHLAKLTASILKNNFLAQNPIIVNKNFDIIDGQHRFEVAKNNDLELYYTIVNKGSIKDVQLLNANNKPWSYADYLESFIDLGNENYVKLKDFINEYDLPINIGVQLISDPNFTVRRSISSNKDYKSGDFKVQAWDEGHELMDKVYDLKPYTNFKSHRDGSFIRAVQILIAKDLYELLIERLSSKEIILRKEALVKHYLRAFEDILNFGQHHNKYRLY